MMFVEQQVQLIERRPRDLPVVFLVQVAQRHGVRKELVEIFDALFTDALGQGDRQLDDVPEWLDLMRVLMRERLGPVQDCVYVDQSFCHRLLLSDVQRINRFPRRGEWWSRLRGTSELWIYRC